MVGAMASARGGAPCASPAKPMSLFSHPSFAA
jgi:hypothetical protein